MKKKDKHVKNQIRVEYDEPTLVQLNIYGQTRTCMMEEMCTDAMSKYSTFSYVFQNPNLNDNEKLLIDFSHWSHWWTHESMMVVNLQGWWKGQYMCRLNNPAIRTKTCAFGKTDSGSKGFLRYFLSHRQICCCSCKLSKKLKENGVLNGSTKKYFFEFSSFFC